MLHILHVITGLGEGGAETALSRLVSSAGRNHYRHTVVALGGGAMEERLRAAGIEVVVLGFRRAPLPAFCRLVALIRAKRPDIVQTWMYHADLVGGLAARLAGNPRVIWGVRTTGVMAEARMTATVRRLCARLSAVLPQAIVCVADAARRSHVACGYDPRRMQVIPNGFDVAALAATVPVPNPLRQSVGLSSSDLVVGTCGRFDADKDNANFIDAAALLAPHYPSLRFLMVGSGLEPGNTALAARLAASGHAARFILLGRRQDVPACLAAMDLFCLPSRNEGFPNVLGEAMALGRACVSTDAGDAPLLLGDAGVVVPKEDAAALARGISSLLDQPPEFRQQLGQRARERVESTYSLRRMRERFEQLYCQLAGKEEECAASPVS